MIILNKDKILEVRTIRKNGTEYYCLRDIGDFIGYKKISNQYRFMNVIYVNTDAYSKDARHRRLGRKKTAYATADEIAKMLIKGERMDLEKRSELANRLNLDKIFIWEREETHFGKVLEYFCEYLHLKLFKQYPIDKYRIDYYVPEIKLAIEYDENGHRSYNKKREEAREKIIKERLGCDILRISNETEYAQNTISCILIILSKYNPDEECRISSANKLKEVSKKILSIASELDVVDGKMCELLNKTVVSNDGFIQLKPIEGSAAYDWINYRIKPTDRN